MGFLSLLLVVLFVGAFIEVNVDAAPFPDADKYTDKYDNIDYSAILKSKRLINNYTKCLTDEGPCTADGLELKKQLPDALETTCSKCTEKQKRGTLDIINAMKADHADEWKELKSRWDPEDKYETKLIEFLKKELGES